MHEYMTLHANSNPLPSHSRLSDATERSWGCRSLLRQGKKWRLPWRSALFSLQGKSLLILKRCCNHWEVRKNTLFYLKMGQW